MISIELARAAAEWWGDRLLNRIDGWTQFRNAKYFEDGTKKETFEGGVFGGFLVNEILKKSPPITEEVAAKYVDALTEGIIEYEARFPDGPTYFTLGTDYHPCSILSNAAKGLEIKNLDLRLPWKTRMRITDDCLEVERDVLWQTKKDALRRSVDARVRTWEEYERSPPHWLVFGYTSPACIQRKNDFEKDVIAANLYLSDQTIVRNRLKKIFEEMPSNPIFDPHLEFDAYVDIIVCDAINRTLSVQGIRPGIYVVDEEGAYTIDTIGPLPDHHRPHYGNIYDEVIVMIETKTKEYKVVGVIEFSNWWIEKKAQKQLSQVLIEIRQ